jgi:CheY-like chemotaxis protein
VAALEAIRRTRPDVVLLDLFMPRMDGLAVLSAMREQKPTRYGSFAATWSITFQTRGSAQ